MATSTPRTTTTVRTASLSVASQHQKSDEDLLTDLFAAYYDARKNKRSTYSQMRFEQNLPANIISLWDDIRLRRYRPGRSMCFIIMDPVQREVFAASFRDRIVHHLLFSYLNPIFESSFIEDSYSCRVGKGTHYGVGRLRTMMKECLSESLYGRAYVLKLDIQGYFMNINRNILYQKIIHAVDDSQDIDFSLVDFLLRLIIFNDPTRGCRIKGSLSDWKGLPPSKSLFHSPPGCGLPIGNLTSQLFSNVYLSALDRFVTSDLGFRYYGRYVDDFFIVSKSQEALKAAIPEIRSFLAKELHLTLHPRKVYLQDVSKGVRFLGHWVFPDCAGLTRRAVARVQRHYLDSFTWMSDPFMAHSVRQSCRMPALKSCNLREWLA